MGIPVTLSMRRRYRAAKRCATVAILGVAACRPDALVNGGASLKAGGDPEARQISVGGTPRDFLLHIPRNVTSAHPMPLVIMLHGSGGNAADLRTTTGMSALADSQKFIVAYADGSHGSFSGYPSDWNAGTCCGAAQREQVDDLGFIQQIISAAAAEHTMNKKRVFVAGFSDGGRMAYHAACHLAPLVAAIAVVSGSLVDDACLPSNTVAVIAIHGTSDDQVLFDEPSSSQPPSPVPAAASALPPSVQFWVAWNGCAKGTSLTTKLTAHVSSTSFTKCPGADVVAYVIEGGVHGWPGLISNDVGSPMTELAASNTIATFFAAHPHR
jgi:polyhydroxybutyrate depolymerase